ncbi:hypothetical protein [Hyphomonas chukchiensis]|uniref:Uncharacterized protein n=1 Tax=Hyphomonas chukchiensis TaxID=1280947 RepID=A0A062UR95_9PROT|nr:hypothetical protein [Hyphomonas chukchiensis]KCZ59677.1 hypothetical protein HY30_13815 [Hyphomonas chukchiensis]
MNSLYLLAAVLSQFGDVRAGYIPADLKVAQVILVVAAGLSIRCLAKAGIKRASVAFCGGVALGTVAILHFGQLNGPPAIVIGFAVVLGVLTAMRFSANTATASIIIFLIGSALTVASVPANGEFPQAFSLMAVNVIAGAGAIICLSQLVVIINPERAPAWRSIAVRIAGSWIVAISVLIIAVSSQTNLF